MFTRDRVLKFLLVLAIFGAADAWIYFTLRGAVRSSDNAERSRKLSLLAMSVPDDTEYLDQWLSGVPETLPGGAAIFLSYPPEDPYTYIARSVDPDALALWQAVETTEDAERGLEAAYYMEQYASPVPLDYQGRQVRLFYAPRPDEAGIEILGIAVFLVPESGGGSVVRLLSIFAIGALVLFGALTGIAKFTRDQTVGYAVLILAALAGVFIVYPLGEALRLSFIRDGHFSLDTWIRSLSGSSLQALWGSVRLGIWTASTSTAVGFMFAFAVYRTSIRGKKFLSAIAQLPVISPPFSLTLSIILLAGNNGLITRQLLGLQNFSIYGLGGLVVVQTIGMFPIAFLTIAGVLQALDSTLEEAALDLNAGRWKVFSTVTLPLAVPGILSAWLLVFTNSLADFANPLLLAGNYRVLSVEAYIQVTGRNDLGGGAALSLLLLLPTLTAFFVQRNWVAKRSFVTVTGKPNAKLVEIGSPGVRAALTVGVWAAAAFILSLYGTIVAGCFVKNWGIDYSFTLSNISEALSRGRDAIRSTVTLAAAATPVAGITCHGGRHDLCAQELLRETCP